MLSLLFGLLSSCGNNFTDVAATRHAFPLSTPQGVYGDVAWIRDQQIAFLYALTPVSEIGVKPSSIKLSKYATTVFDLDSRQWHVYSIPTPDNCISGWVSLLRRLPNGQLGFLYQCNLEDREKRTLAMWSQSFQSYTPLHEYPEQFFATTFTFAPDMSELVQEKDGDRKYDQLFRVSKDGQMEQVAAIFQRAHVPSWSPNGRIIAFAANEKVPDSRSNPFTALTGIADVVFYPWNIYLMNSDGSNLRMILSEVVDVNVVKWSPQSTHVAFRGTYQKADGIWILNTETSRLTRIWPSLDMYDWSPDGNKMVIIQSTRQGQLMVTTPVMLDGRDLE